jgi:tetratricopeptide (TPR) repeat protein
LTPRWTTQFTFTGSPTARAAPLVTQPSSPSRRAIAAAPRSTRPHLALINYFGNLRDGKAALDAAKDAQRAFPDDTQILEAVGAAQRATGQIDQAIATFQRLVQLQPQNVSALMRLADAQVAQKDYRAGIATLRRVIEADPQQGRALLALAKVFVISGHPEDAIAEARKLQKDYPKRSMGYALEGEVLAAQAKWPQAAAAYRDAISREAIPMLAVRRYEVLQKVGAADASAFAAQWAKDHLQRLAKRKDREKSWCPKLPQEPPGIRVTTPDGAQRSPRARASNRRERKKMRTHRRTRRASTT